ncbi:conserved hypothetical protein [delta proteobacterium NaphS2]|nr:conserved hypothetical protein [delta proteobacterium NaphS2]
MTSKRIVPSQTMHRTIALNRNENPPKSGRFSTLKFWEIAPFFKCPVVGICLTLSEQRQVLKKAGVSPKGRSPFEIHELLVGCSDNENRVSKQVDRLLNRKFRAEITPLLELNEKVFIGQWASYFHGGTFVGAFWAASIKPDLSAEARGRIFGDVHMSMHGNVEQDARFKRQLALYGEEAAKMREKAREATRSRKTLQKENAKLQKNQENLLNRLASDKKEMVSMTETLASVKAAAGTEELEREIERLGEDLVDLMETIKVKDTRLADFERKNRQLSAALVKQKDANVSLQNDVEMLIQGAFRGDRCDDTCPSYNLCQKRVLMVGGITKMASLYRQMIETRNGIFEYHDGYMKNGAKNLEHRVRRADMVLCPINCNSHAACALVKKLGKKHKKPVRLLPSSSLNAIGEAISGKRDIYASDN